MPEIDRPCDAADDEHESVEGRYEGDQWVTDVWGNRVNMRKDWCGMTPVDADGNPVPRPRRQIDDLPL